MNDNYFNDEPLVRKWSTSRIIFSLLIVLVLVCSALFAIKHFGNPFARPAETEKSRLPQWQPMNIIIEKPEVEEEEEENINIEIPSVKDNVTDVNPDSDNEDDEIPELYVGDEEMHLIEMSEPKLPNVLDMFS